MSVSVTRIKVENPLQVHMVIGTLEKLLFSDLENSWNFVNFLKVMQVDCSHYKPAECFVLH